MANHITLHQSVHRALERTNSLNKSSEDITEVHDLSSFLSVEHPFALIAPLLRLRHGLQKLVDVYGLLRRCHISECVLLDRIQRFRGQLPSVESAASSQSLRRSYTKRTTHLVNGLRRRSTRRWSLERATAGATAWRRARNLCSEVLSIDGL